MDAGEHPEAALTGGRDVAGHGGLLVVDALHLVEQDHVLPLDRGPLFLLQLHGLGVVVALGVGLAEGPLLDRGQGAFVQLLVAAAHAVDHHPVEHGD